MCADQGTFRSTQVTITAAHLRFSSCVYPSSVCETCSPCVQDKQVDMIHHCVQLSSAIDWGMQSVSTIPGPLALQRLAWPKADLPAWRPSCCWAHAHGLAKRLTASQINTQIFIIIYLGPPVGHRTMCTDLALATPGPSERPAGCTPRIQEYIGAWTRSSARLPAHGRLSRGINSLVCCTCFF